MSNDILILIVEAMAVYFLVLWTHSLRHRFGPIYFYALIGGITAIMSWVTDAGTQIQVSGITFMVGSTVLYTSLLLGIFVVYVFDGPRAARTVIFTVVGVSILVPLIAMVLHFQMHVTDHTSTNYIPLPSLRINTVSVIATILDLVFLAIAWECLGKPRLQIQLWLRVFLTLLGVMWLDVILFATGAFAGNPEYLSIMQGTLISRFIVTIFACPLLYTYLNWQNTKKGIAIENRPVLSILKQVAEIKIELSLAQQEIERRKRAVDALRKSEEKLRTIIEHSNELFYIHDTEHALTYASQTSEDLLGYTPEEMMIKWTELATDNPINQKGLEITTQGIATGEKQAPYLLELRKKDGTKVLLEIDESPVKDATGKVVAISGAARDVTEQKRTEQRLLKSEKGFRDLFDSITDLIYTQDLDGRFISVNRAMGKVFGYEKDELIGRRASDFMMPKMAPFFKSEYLEQIKTKGSHEGVTSYFAKNGEKIYIDYRSSLVDPDDEEPYISGTGREITEQIRVQRKIKKLQEEMLQLEKMEAMATLAGGIAHKFNNALSAITGNADLLEMAFPGDDKIKRHVTPMKESALQMAHLSAQLLAYTGGGKYNPAIISPTQLVKETLDLIEHTVDPDIDIETDLPSDIMSIEADNTQMQMVLSAIIANANDAIENKGRIRITAKNEEIDADFAKTNPALRPGRYIALTLEDDGRGMDEETKARIFEPFFTTHFMGRGLAMAAVYGIIRNHNGWITVDSEVGKGTKVVIYLPAVSAESKVQEATAVKQPEVEAISGAGTVLIIEDEEIVLEVTEAMVEALGYRVLTAKTGNEAITVAGTFDGNIDLALLDIKLPDMEGGKVYQRIMEVRPDLKVIVCSGYAIEGPAQEILNAGAQGFIHKPASLEVFSDELKKVLGD